MYCQEKMEEGELKKEMEAMKRRMSINRRETVYQKERRRSDGKDETIYLNGESFVGEK